MTKSCDSSPSVIPTSSGSLWFVDRDWKIVCSNNHKSNNPPLLLVEAASFDASLPSLQHRPFHELWILAGWKTTFTFEWTLGDYSQGIWWYMIPGWMLFRHVPPISGSHLAHHSRPSTISRRLHICNRQGSSLQVSWSRLPNLLEHIPPKKKPKQGEYILLPYGHIHGIYGNKWGDFAVESLSAFVLGLQLMQFRLYELIIPNMMVS